MTCCFVKWTLGGAMGPSSRLIIGNEMQPYCDASVLAGCPVRSPKICTPLMPAQAKTETHGSSTANRHTQCRAQLN